VRTCKKINWRDGKLHRKGRILDGLHTQAPSGKGRPWRSQRDPWALEALFLIDQAKAACKWRQEMSGSKERHILDEGQDPGPEVFLQGNFVCRPLA